MGHERCGAVKAAAGGGARPASPNLAALVDGISPALQSLPEHERGGDRGVQANVSYRARQLLAQSEALRKSMEAGRVKVIEAVCDLDSGRVVPLIDTASRRD